MESTENEKRLLVTYGHKEIPKLMCNIRKSYVGFSL